MLIRRHHLVLLALTFTLSAATGCQWLFKKDQPAADGPQVQAPAPNPEIYAGIQQGQPAPDFTMPDILTGQNVRLADHRGKWVVLKTWVSWCAVCRGLSNSWAKPLHDELGSAESPRVVIISVGMNLNEKGPDAQAAFARTNNHNWPHVFDTAGEYLKSYGVNGQPSYVLIDPDGNVVSFGLLAEHAETLTAYLRQQTASAPSTARGEGHFAPALAMQN